MNRKSLGNLTFFVGIFIGGLAMRGWLEGNLAFPGLPTPPPRIADPGATPRSDPDETSPVGATAPVEATPTQTPTPTPTLVPPAEPTPALEGLILLESGWTFTTPERLAMRPIVTGNGVIYLLGESGTLYALNPDGTPRMQIALGDFLDVRVFDDGTILVHAPERVYALEPNGSPRWEFSVQPAVGNASMIFQPDQAELFVLLGVENMVHAFTLADGLLWEYTLENGLRDESSHPSGDGEGNVYYVDRRGILYAFTAAGLAWTYVPEEGLRAASDPVIGPDGHLYYVLTTGTEGRLQSITREGQPRWRTNLKTFRFYTRPEFSAAGEYVFVREDLVRADTGALVDSLEFPFDVHAFIKGEDGFDYLLTGNNVIRWQVGPGGFEMLNTVTFNAEGLDTFSQPQVRVYATGLVELFYTTRDGPYLVWLSPEGDVLLAQPFEWSDVRLFLGRPDPELVLCSFVRDLGFHCRKFVPGSAEPVWEQAYFAGALEGVPGLFDRQPYYRNGRLYLITTLEDVRMRLYVADAQIP